MTDWTDEWPTEPGWYWFWGRCSKKRPIGLRSAVVRKCPDGMAYVVDGYFTFKEEGAEGLWCPAVLPDLPEEAT